MVRMQIRGLRGRWGMHTHTGKQVIALRTDFRRSGSYEKVNLMLEESATVVTSIESLLDAVKSPLTVKSDS